MKCPACFNELAPVKVGSVTVDACRGGCGGIWFDQFELQKVDERHETEGNPLLHLEIDPSIVVDPSRKRNCPRCEGVKLMRHFFSPEKRVKVDQCPNCGGYWLDAGELAAIQHEKAAASSRQPATHNISADFIRYLYRLQQDRD